jgi:hypothetical protein
MSIRSVLALNQELILRWPYINESMRFCGAAVERLRTGLLKGRKSVETVGP